MPKPAAPPVTQPISRKPQAPVVKGVKHAKTSTEKKTKLLNVSLAQRGARKLTRFSKAFGPVAALTSIDLCRLVMQTAAECPHLEKNAPKIDPQALIWALNKLDLCHMVQPAFLNRYQLDDHPERLSLTK